MASFTHDSGGHASGSPPPDRRAVLAGLGASLAAPALAAPDARMLPQPFHAAAASRGILFGAAANWEVLDDAPYGALHTRHSRLFVPANGMKFDWLNAKEGPPDFANVERLLAFSQAGGMGFRGAALIWNDWPPPWLKGKSSREIERAMERHLETVCTRFAGKVQSYDVVNEPFYPGHRQPGGYRAGPFLAAMGEDYIFKAFRRVASIDRNAKLVLNEAFCEHSHALGLSVRPLLLTLIDKMLDRGIKLDAIGLQSHLQPGEPFDGESYARFLEEIGRRGLKIYLTEFDVDDQRLPRETTKRDWMAADFATDFLTIALANPAVNTLICWNLADRYTWYREAAVAAQRKRDFPARTLPFDDHLMEKPLALALRAALLAAPVR